MGRVLRVLCIAESANDPASIRNALQTGGFTIECRCVQAAAELREALAGQRWDVVTCSVRGSLPPGPLMALDSLPTAARPPLILIADRFESAALEAYRWSALVCLRDRLSLQLPAAVENLLGEADARAAERGAREFERGQRQLLERIATGVPLRELLEQIVRLVEAQSEGMLCSILLLDKRRLRHGAHSSLPDEFIRNIDGSLIGPNAGSCGSAAHRGERVIVEDIATHAYWNDYRHLALPLGLRACWSSPIFSPERDVLGTFAMYYREPRGPNPSELAWVDRATHLAAIAICRDRDITELRRAELALRQSQRMETLGTLAGGIAHDFNNILAAISGNLGLVVGDLPEQHAVQGCLSEIDVGVKRATELVRQILTFSRHQESRPQPIRLESVTDEAVQLLRATMQGGIQIETRYAPELPEVLADPTQLHQVVMNLATNALLAMQQHGGTLSIRAESTTEDARKTAGATELRGGNYVKLEVSDTGVGMHASTLERIFDPFFTTRGAGSGTGLGLSVVHGIVESHGGAIEVRSKPGEGSCFSVYLPAVTRPRVAPARPGRMDHAPGEGERVLCLDDEAVVVRVSTEMLRRLGYRPTGHTDALQALEAFRADPSAFDLLLTDFAMPKLSGHELVAAFQRLRRGLPIVVTTGRIDGPDIDALNAVGIREVLLKPSSVAELSTALRRALRDRR